MEEHAERKTIKPSVKMQSEPQDSIETRHDITVTASTKTDAAPEIPITEMTEEDDIDASINNLDRNDYSNRIEITTLPLQAENESNHEIVSSPTADNIPETVSLPLRTENESNTEMFSSPTTDDNLEVLTPSYIETHSDQFSPDITEDWIEKNTITEEALIDKVKNIYGLYNIIERYSGLLFILNNFCKYEIELFYR
jgi:hypothetical protein